MLPEHTFVRARWRRAAARGRTGVGSGKALLILAGALAAFGPAATWARDALETEAETDPFERIFGKRPPAPARTINVSFILDQRRREEIPVVVAASPDALRIRSAALLAAIGDLARPDILERLMSAAGPQHVLSLDQLKENGLEARWDEQRLELHVDVPPESRRDSTVQVYGRFLPEAASRALPTSTFSAYLNLRTGLDYVHRSSTGGPPGVQPFRADFEGAVNLHDWVAEGSASYTEGASSPWRHGFLRLVRDDPARRIRYSLGDLAYPTAGFQSFQPLVGLTVARNFSLQPYRVTEPRGRTSFFLRSPSKVEVLVNGQPTRTLQLPAGPHHFQDFLFTNGSNDVVLQIVDDVGRVEIIEYSFFFDTRLLADGEHEFSYSLGVPARRGALRPPGESEEPVASLFHRIGFSDTFTAGLNLQGDARQQLLGAESVWATPYGIFQPEVALSRIDGSGGGHATRLGYRYYDATRIRRGSWAVSAQYRSRSFASLGNLEPNNAVSWNFSARYSHRLTWGLSGGIGGNYQIRRHGADGLFGGNIHLSKRFGNHVSADVTLEHREIAGGLTENRAFISFSLLFPGRRQSFRASHDTLSRTSRADWQYTARDAVGGFDGNVGIQHRPDDYSLFGGLRYTGYRAEAILTHDLTSPTSANDRTDSRTRFRFGTALVYADGHFALSRPVSDSFALVMPHPDLKGHSIGVDPLRHTYAAKIDRWGPAVVPNLSSYLVRSVIVDAPELPPGYELGPGTHAVWPTYRSGTVIRVGTGATVLLSGLLESEGEPVALQLGEIVSLSDPERPPIELFTNRRGKFSVTGLRPGTYEIRMFNGVDPARFEIPAGKAGLYDIGALRMPKSSHSEPPQAGG